MYGNVVNKKCITQNLIRTSIFFLLLLSYSFLNTTGKKKEMHTTYKVWHYERGPYIITARTTILRFRPSKNWNMSFIKQTTREIFGTRCESPSEKALKSSNQCQFDLLLIYWLQRPWQHRNCRYAIYSCCHERNKN